MTSTISSPSQIHHGVTKVSAKRAPEIGEHNEQILKELGFDPKKIESFVTSGVLGAQRQSATK